MKRLALTFGLLAALQGIALAQPADGGPSADLTVGSFDPESSTVPVAGVEGPGIKVGEGTVVHPVVGLSTGAVSNVFYEEDGTNAAGVLRLLAQVGAGSLSPAPPPPTTAGKRPP